MTEQEYLEFRFIQTTLMDFGYRLRELFVRELSRERGKSNLIKAVHFFKFFFVTALVRMMDLC